MRRGTVLVGTCAFADHASFYPPGLAPGDRLGYYARYFRLVEVDATFYRELPASHFARFAARTPPDFRFGVKAFRTLTLHDHSPPDPSAKADAVRRLAASLAPLADAGKLQFVLFQFPPWFTREAANERYLAWLAEALPRWTLAVEFRHQSWWPDGVRSATAGFLRTHGLVHVVADEPAVGTGHVPFIPLVTVPELAILRLHGRNRDTWSRPGLASSGERFRYRYEEAELRSLLDTALELAQEADTVDVLFNNNYRDYAVRNALEAEALLGRDLPPATLFPS